MGTPFEQMVENKLLDENVFAFALSSDPRIDGELSFGGIDKDKFSGDLTYVELTNETYWQIEMENMKLGDDTIISSPMAAIIDSGTSLLTGPMDKVNAIAQKAGATCILGKDCFISCDNISALPTLTVTLGRKAFTLEGMDYVIQMQGQCLFAFTGIEMPPSVGPLFIMGDVFMRKYYTVFDYGNKQVGFAPYKTAKASSDATLMI